MSGNISSNKPTATTGGWFYLPEPPTTWLIDGLIPMDGWIMICGKPKSGKSCFVRRLAASIVKGQKFLGRSVDIPKGTGKVLYVHLDRKDRPGRVAAELRQIGISEEESKRLILCTVKNMPDGKKERFDWLKKQVLTTKPHLIVIDLLWQFLDLDGANDYKPVLKGINELQDALDSIGYTGATIVAHHGRKAVNPDHPTDDILGSTAQSASFVTTIMLSRNRRKNYYTIMSEQTIRDKIYGEIDETVIIKNPDDDSLSLGSLVSELEIEATKQETEADIQRLLSFIDSHQGCEMEEILSALSVSKKRVLKLIEKTSGLIRIEGKGIKGDPHKYYGGAVDPVTQLGARFADPPKGGIQ
jgi:KaiC/GvpD/RAD55 family RecA-like ATPase